jgi:predicted ATP-dependent endonuclease of OLD family
LFPLQAALGYDIAQNLFISKNNLLVEGVSDLIYLQTLSGVMEENGRVCLSEDITIVPVGGLDKVSVFIALLGASKLNIACLLDSSIDTKNKQKLDNLISEKLIKQSKVLFYDAFLEDGIDADIEDLFTKEEYLKFFNKAFKGRYDEINLIDLNSSVSRITLQISQHLGIKRFNHYMPAKNLLQNPVFVSNIDASTLNRYESLFKKVNNLFET